MRDSHWDSVHVGLFAAYLAATLIASGIKFRLPGLQGTHSTSALFLLFGVAHFSFPEVMLLGLGSAVVGSLWNAKQRPTAVQVAFNAANVCLTVGACCLVAGTAFHRATTRPAVMALLAAVYFPINTIIVSGILSLLQGRRLTTACETWYLDWFPYYIAGAALVGLLGKGWHQFDPQSWLVLPPLMYLIHFYAGLSVRQNKSDLSGDAELLPPRPRLSWLYLGTVIAAGSAVLASALFHWQTASSARFFGYLVATIAVATWKVRLPRINGALSMNFVMVLLAITELSFSEAVLIAAVGALVQSLWKPKVRPIQVLFNISCLAVSSSLAYHVCRTWLQVATGQSLALAVSLSTAILFAADSLLVVGVLHLVERQPLHAIWRNCFYWAYLLLGRHRRLRVDAIHRANFELAVIVAGPPGHGHGVRFSSSASTPGRTSTHLQLSVCKQVTFASFVRNGVLLDALRTSMALGSSSRLIAAAGLCGPAFFLAVGGANCF